MHPLELQPQVSAPGQSQAWERQALRGKLKGHQTLAKVKRRQALRHVGLCCCSLPFVKAKADTMRSKRTEKAQFHGAVQTPDDTSLWFTAILVQNAGSFLSL